MKKEKQVKHLIIRYLILFMLAIPNFWLFYAIFTPLTIYTSFFLLDLFFNSALVGNAIFISGRQSIEIIPACVAVLAYYLLFFLNLSIPKIKAKKRIQMIAFSFSALFIANVLRIFFLSLLFINESAFFDITHRIFWYFVSIILVIAIWFTEVKLFNLKDIPVFTDLNFLKQINDN
jgi:exosortase/archaeosortase family protein